LICFIFFLGRFLLNAETTKTPPGAFRILTKLATKFILSLALR